MSYKAERLRYKFNDESGYYEYVLLRCPQVMHRGYNTFVASGNKAWAKRIAKHYGIDMPEEEE